MLALSYLGIFFFVPERGSITNPLCFSPTGAEVTVTAAGDLDEHLAHTGLPAFSANAPVISVLHVLHLKHYKNKLSRYQ